MVPGPGLVTARRPVKTDCIPLCYAYYTYIVFLVALIKQKCRVASAARGAQQANNWGHNIQTAARISDPNPNLCNLTLTHFLDFAGASSHPEVRQLRLSGHAGAP